MGSGACSMSNGRGTTASYMPLTADATRRAAELDRRHLRDGTVFPHDNPSSGMHRLLAAVALPSV